MSGDVVDQLLERLDGAMRRRGLVLTMRLDGHAGVDGRAGVRVGATRTALRGQIGSGVGYGETLRGALEALDADLRRTGQ